MYSQCNRCNPKTFTFGVQQLKTDKMSDVKVTNVKAKFKCQSVTNFGPGGKTAELNAVYGTDGENGDFTKSTPNGQLKISISNETPAADFFEPGKDYYLIFEAVPEA